MTRFLDKARTVFGIETAAERQVWDTRIELLRNTVGINYNDQEFQRRLSREIELFQAAEPSHRPYSQNALTICAEERLRVRALCAARCALPSAGVEVPQLRELGFDTGMPGTERYFGILRVVGFPEGWQMIPASQEPDTIRASRAVILDEEGVAQLDIFYRNSVVGDSIKGYTELMQPQV